MEDASDAIHQMQAEAQLDSAGIFTLAREQAAAKLLLHLGPHRYDVYAALLQWMIGLGCSQASLEFVKGMCVVCGLTPRQDPLADWPGENLEAFLAAEHPLDRIRGRWILELSRQENHPAWIETWEEGRALRKIPLFQEQDGQRRAVTPSIIPGRGTAVVVLFTYIPTGEDHQSDTFSHLNRVFRFSPIPLKMRTHSIIIGQQDQDLRRSRWETQLRLPLLFDAYANHNLGGKGILLRPPTTRGRAIYAAGDQAAQMELSPAPKVQPFCSLARYFSAKNWPWPQQVEAGNHSEPLTLNTGLGSLAIYCSGDEVTDQLTPVVFGAALNELSGELGLPGFQVVACADGLLADLGGQSLLQNEAYQAWLQNLRASLREFIDQALARPPEPCQKVSAEVVNASDGINLAILASMLCLPIAFETGLIIPGLLLSGGSIWAIFRYASRNNISQGARWKKEEIAEYLEKCRQRLD